MKFDDEIQQQLSSLKRGDVTACGVAIETLHNLMHTKRGLRKPHPEVADAVRKVLFELETPEGHVLLQPYYLAKGLRLLEFLQAKATIPELLWAAEHARRPHFLVFCWELHGRIEEGGVADEVAQPVREFMHDRFLEARGSFDGCGYIVLDEARDVPKCWKNWLELALDFLGLLHDPRGLRAALDTLAGREASAYPAACRCLLRLGEAGLVPFSEQASIRDRLLPLVRLGGIPNETCGQAAKALCRLGGVAPVLQRIPQLPMEAREQCCNAIAEAAKCGLVGGQAVERAVQVMEWVLRQERWDNCEDDKGYAVQALVALQGEAVIPTLQGFVTLFNSALVVHCCVGLRTLVQGCKLTVTGRREAVQMLRKVVALNALPSNTAVFPVDSVVPLLVSCGGAEAVGLLLEYAQKGVLKGSFRTSCMDAVLELHSKGKVPKECNAEFLIVMRKLADGRIARKLAKHRQVHAQREGIEALGKLGDLDSVPLLASLSGGEDAYLSSASEDALRSIFSA